jgi:hypothetical protein
MEKLIFVYNADSGKWNAYMDMAHKIFSPKTYPCSLCDLTYGIFKIRPEWDDFVKKSPIPFEFLHKDEFVTSYPDLKDITLPVILILNKNIVSVFIDQQELNSFNTISSLKQRILEKLENIYRRQYL